MVEGAVGGVALRGSARARPKRSLRRLGNKKRCRRLEAACSTPRSSKTKLLLQGAGMFLAPSIRIGEVPTVLSFHFTPARSAPLKLAMLRSASMRLAPLRLAPLRSAPEKPKATCVGDTRINQISRNNSSPARRIFRLQPRQHSERQFPRYANNFRSFWSILQPLLQQQGLHLPDELSHPEAIRWSTGGPLPDLERDSQRHRPLIRGTCRFLE